MTEHKKHELRSAQWRPSHSVMMDYWTGVWSVCWCFLVRKSNHHKETRNDQWQQEKHQQGDEELQQRHRKYPQRDVTNMWHKTATDFKPLQINAKWLQRDTKELQRDRKRLQRDKTDLQRDIKPPQKDTKWKQRDTKPPQRDMKWPQRDI